MESLTTVSWITILILIGVVIALVTTFIRKKENRKPNYKAFFIIGITWIPIGIAVQNYVLMLLGLAFLIYGMTKKKEWENQPKWSELTPAEKKIKIVVTIFLALILISGIVSYIIASK